MGRLLVISPHLDDAVFACGDALRACPGAMVITVFAGGPQDWTRQTLWDSAAGFEPGQDVLRCRREEDRQALSLLGARPRWLPFWPSQYGCSPSGRQIMTALADTIGLVDPGAILMPFGLWHRDHRLTHQAAIELLALHRHRRWFAYEDAIYRRWPDAGLQARHAELRARGIRPVAPVVSQTASEPKRRSVACYRSQLRALATPGRPGAGDALEPERHWALVPAGEPE